VVFVELVVSFSFKITESTSCCFSGKTAIIRVIKDGKFDQSNSYPTIGVDFERVHIGKVVLRAWEPGGRERFRVISQSYYRTAKGFIFLVDSNDRCRMNEARQELHQMKNEGRLDGKPILILANKQDLPDAMSIDEIRNELALHELDEKIIWHLQGASAVRNQGIQEGFQWIADQFVTSFDVMQPILETINDSVKIKNQLFTAFSWDNWTNRFKRCLDFVSYLLYFK